MSDVAKPVIPELPVEEFDDSSTQPRRGLRGRIVLALANIWLVYHLCAITLAPLSVDPAAPIVRQAWNFTGPYSQALYLNHGYHYFAPNPSGATLLAYELTFEDGHTEAGRIPNKNIRPRLFYHRHFMLTEYIGQIEQFPPDLQQTILKAYAEGLCRQHGAISVRLSKVYHDVSSMERILAGGTLTDDDTYFSTDLGEYSWSDF